MLPLPPHFPDPRTAIKDLCTDEGRALLLQQSGDTSTCALYVAALGQLFLTETGTEEAMSAADILLDLASARPYARAQVLAVPGLVDGLIADALALHKRSTKAAANGSGGGEGGGGDEKGWEGGDASTAVAAAASAAVDRRLMLLQRIMYGAELFLDVPAGLDQLITMLIAT
eukprot:gene14275-11474_t